MGHFATQKMTNSLFLMRISRCWYHNHNIFGFKQTALNWEVNHERNRPHTRANRTLDDPPPPNWRTIEIKVRFKTKFANRLHAYGCSNWPHSSGRHNNPLDSAVWKDPSELQGLSWPPLTATARDSPCSCQRCGAAFLHSLNTKYQALHIKMTALECRW